MQASSESPVSTGAFASPIVDLRQYTLHPGTRDDFIRLFDGQFVETQEVCGMRLIGQFRDLGDPNRFVWMRGFADMPSRSCVLRPDLGDALLSAGASATGVLRLLP
jgi:NIPSNAP